MKVFKKIVVFFLVTAILTSSTFLFSGMLMKRFYPITYSDTVEKYCRLYNVEKKVVFAVIKCESNFKSDAVSDVGAMGLMQILPDTFFWLQTKTGEDLSEDALFNSEVSIRYGTLLISILLSELNGNEETAVAAYHAGIGSIKTWLKDKKYSSDEKTLKKIPYRDTNVYVERVKTTIKIYEKLYNM